MTDWKIPLLRPELGAVPDLSEVWRTGVLTNGPACRDLEAMVAERQGAEHAVAVSSCTSGLMLCLEALGLRGKRVAVPAFTFAATAVAARWVTDDIVWMDEAQYTPCLDEAQYTPCSVYAPAGLDGCVVVNVFGRPPRLNASPGWTWPPVVEDAAQGIGAERRKGVASVYSFSPSKLATACEGGVVVTDNARLAERLRYMRDYGMARDRSHVEADVPYLGLSARMSEVHALIAIESMRRLDEVIEMRRGLVALYASGLEQTEGVEVVTDPGGTCAYMAVRIPGNSVPLDEAFADLVGGGWAGVAHFALADYGIQTKRYFRPCAHHLALFGGPPVVETCPNAVALSNQCLALPLWSGMVDAEVREVCAAIKEVLG